MLTLTTIIRVVLLLWVSNGAPIIAAKLFGKHFATPIDLGFKLYDRQPLFGRSKTWRGIIAAYICTVPLGLLLGFDWHIAVLITSASLGGDLTSSFVKRRLGLAPSKQAQLLDQVPEALFPVCVLMFIGLLTWLEAIIVVVIFVITDILLSKLLYRWKIRKKPY